MAARNSAQRRKNNPDENLPERPRESTSSAQVHKANRASMLTGCNLRATVAFVIVPRHLWCHVMYILAVHEIV